MGSLWLTPTFMTFVNLGVVDSNAGQVALNLTCTEGKQFTTIIYTKYSDMRLQRNGSSAAWAFYNISQIARFMGPTWGLPGDDRTQVGPMLAPWTEPCYQSIVLSAAVDVSNLMWNIVAIQCNYMVNISIKSSRGLLKQIIPIFTSIYENMKLLKTCFRLIKVIYKFRPIHSYTTFLTSASCSYLLQQLNEEAWLSGIFVAGSTNPSGAFRPLLSHPSNLPNRSTP